MPLLLLLLVQFPAFSKFPCTFYFILHIKIIKQVGVVHIPDFDHILQSYNAADTALHTGKFLYRIIVFDENKGNGNSAHCCHRQISQLRIHMETILQDKQNHDP